MIVIASSERSAASRCKSPVARKASVSATTQNTKWVSTAFAKVSCSCPKVISANKHTRSREMKYSVYFTRHVSDRPLRISRRAKRNEVLLFEPVPDLVDRLFYAAMHNFFHGASVRCSRLNYRALTNRGLQIHCFGGKSLMSPWAVHIRLRTMSTFSIK